MSVLGKVITKKKILIFRVPILQLIWQILSEIKNFDKKVTSDSAFVFLKTLKINFFRVPKKRHVRVVRSQKALSRIFVTCTSFLRIFYSC